MPVEGYSNDVTFHEADTQVRPDRQEAIRQRSRLRVPDVRICKGLPDEDPVLYGGVVAKHEFRYTGSCEPQIETSRPRNHSRGEPKSRR